MKTLYCHDQTQYEAHLSLQKENFINSVISCNEQNNHTFLCPIFSLKFNISVTIWDSNTPTTTHHYSYSNINGVIKYDTCRGYQYHIAHNWGLLLYITIGGHRIAQKSMVILFHQALTAFQKFIRQHCIMSVQVVKQQLHINQESCTIMFES